MPNFYQTGDDSRYDVRGFVTENTDKGCDSQRGADTLKEARRIAKYWMSEEYMRVIESTSPTVVVQIWKNDELLEEKYA